jgi:hypothetical protein
MATIGDLYEPLSPPVAGKFIGTILTRTQRRSYARKRERMNSENKPKSIDDDISRTEQVSAT